MIRKIFAHSWVATLVACLLLAILIYFVGPLLQIGTWRPFASDWVIWVCVLSLFVGWAAVHGFVFWRRRRNDKALTAGLTAGADPAGAEVAMLRQRIETCQARLREAAHGSGMARLSELPWYILIGPPGAGKTTALLKSGLRFIGTDGKNPAILRGVGGTRNCDWFFAEQAVLIDTAGRFTTQDSNPDIDNSTWKGFLKLLKEQRPRQPINGALVAVSLPELAAMSEHLLVEHAQTIRSRVQELREHLAVEFPVYVIFTKLDLLNGFNEFFGHLSKEERAQVWGMTLPVPETKIERPDDLAGLIASGLDGLLTRLSERMLERVHEEADPGRRSLVHAYPFQLATTWSAIQDFLETCFGSSRYDQPALLRGFYFTSGTQEGTPIDRIVGILARSFGLSFSARAGLGGSGRSYFIADLLEKVVFPEAGLVGLDPKVERRLRSVRIGSYMACSSMLVVALLLWAIGTYGNLAMISGVAMALPGYRAAVAPIADRPVTTADLTPLREPLRQLRGLANRDGQRGGIMTGFGLSQAANLDEGGKIAYANGLNTLLLPRLMLQLDQYLRESQQHPELQYRVLKAYLMLGGHAPVLERSFIEPEFDEIWDQAGIETGFRTELGHHLAALLDNTLPPVALDQPLVDQTRDKLRAITPALRAYTTIKDGENAHQLKDWVLLDHAGINAERVLVLRSGASLQKASVPGIFTRDGFYRVMLPGAANAATSIASEQWVVGDRGEISGEKIKEIEQGVIAAYETDFIDKWDRLLSDLAIKPFKNTVDAAETLTILAGPSSPFKALFPDIVKETQLTKPPEELAVASVIAPGESAKVERIGSQFGRIAQAAGVQGAKPGATVEAHFVKLAQYVGVGSGSSQVDGIMREFGQAAEQLRRADTPGQDNSMGTAIQTASSLKQLNNEAGSLPSPLGTMVGSIGRDASGLATSGARDQIRGDWNTAVLQECMTTIDGRYPMQRNGVLEVQPDDLARVMGPGGLIESYFDQNLRTLVDVSSSTWRWKSGGGTDVGFNPHFLVEIQRADAIKKQFFLNGATQFGFRATIIPRDLDPGSKSVELEIDGQTISFQHDAPRSTAFSWPGPNGTDEIRLTFLDAHSGQSSSISSRGPWSWYHFVGQGETSSAGDGVLLTFHDDGHAVTYEVRGKSVLTPLTLQSLGDFQCPRL